MTQLCGRGLTAVDRKDLKFKIVALNYISEILYVNENENDFIFVMIYSDLHQETSRKIITIIKS